MTKINTDDIAQLYTSGVAVKSISDKLGISKSVIYRTLTNLGIDKPNPRIIQFTDKQISDIVSEYALGVGYEGVALRHGVSGSVIKRILIENGVHIRNRSEQQFARMSIATPDEIKQLTKAAHAAATGRKKTTREKELAAITREKNLTSVSQLELEFANIFTEAGYSFTQQKALGVYNCDFVIGTVAVEIWGGNWHFTGNHIERTPERVKYIIDSGFDIIIVPINVSNILGSGLKKELIRNINELSRNPSSIGEYRMIWRNGDLVTSGGRDCDLGSFEPPFTNRANPVTGRYETVFK